MLTTFNKFKYWVWSGDVGTLEFIVCSLGMLIIIVVLLYWITQEVKFEIDIHK